MWIPSLRWPGLHRLVISARCDKQCALLKHCCKAAPFQGRKVMKWNSFA